MRAPVPAATHPTDRHVTEPADPVSPAARRPGAVAVIGAGVAGLACARTLHDAGVPVTVFEKSRGVGGRSATRRVELGGAVVQFDHGAQYFTARDADFAAAVRDWEARGLVARWAGRIAVVDSGAVTAPPAPAPPRWVGTRGMSAVGRALAAGLDVRLGSQISGLRATGAGWHVEDERGAPVADFTDVVVAVPAPQAAPLLRAAAPALARDAARAVMTPCWSAMLAFPEPVPVAFDGAFVGARGRHRGEGSVAGGAADGSGRALSWVARDSSKPGRPREGAECWVAHATPEWSAAHLERAAGDVARALARAFAEELGGVPAPHVAIAHRWRYATPAPALDAPFLFDPAVRLGACGDWCGGPRVEGAYRSGRALAARILGGRRE